MKRMATPTTTIILFSGIPANSGYAITGAVGINDLGEILCSATTASSASRTIVLTPK
jgi:hypothetical protein